MRRWCQFAVLVAVGVFAAGCPKDKHDYKEARRAVDLKDYDAAVDYYLKATKSDPHNVSYKIGLDQSRFEAGAAHVQKGLKLRDKGDLQGAVSEFQRAQIMDPRTTRRTRN
jgi:general secretion pathway protein D